MKVTAIVQARTGSTRLPTKVLLKIGAKTMLEHVVQRLKRSKLIDSIVIATTTLKSDDKVVNLAKKMKVSVFRGSEFNVLDRYYQTAKKFKADLIVRVTSDCPLISPYVVDKVIKRYKKSKADYTLAISREGNPLSYPRGVNVEVFSFRALEEVYEKARWIYQREHVTVYLEEHPEKYRIELVEAEKELRRPSYRLTVDTKEDLELVRKIYSSFPQNKFITLADVIRLLDENPEFVKINLGVIQKKCSRKLKERRINSRVLFRVDASRKLGIGHIMRCLSLAKELGKLGYEPLFLSHKDSVTKRIIAGKYQTIDLSVSKSPTREVFNVRKIISEIAPLATVVDLNNVDHDYFMALKQFSGLLIDINGESHSDLYSDVFAKGDVDAKASEQTFADYLLGPKYKIVGNELSILRDKDRKPPPKIEKILISMGGSDPNNLTLKVTRALIHTDFRVNIVIGPGFGKKKELFNLVKGKRNFFIMEMPKDFKNLLALTDICFISGGVTLYEAVCLGTPAVVLCQNQLQLNDALTLQEHRACICLGLGRKVSLQKIKDSLKRISSLSLRKEIQENGMRILDGLGVKRIAKEIHIRLKKTRGKKILVVGAGHEQTNIIKAGKLLGCQVISVDRDPCAIGFLFSDYHYIVDTRDSDSIQSIAKKHNIDGIITSTETGVKSVSLVAFEMGIPNISPLSASLATDKSKMRQILLKSGISVPEFAIVKNLQDVINAVQKIGLSVVLKPCDNGGARGVKKVVKIHELEEGYNLAMSNTKLPYVLVEKFIEGSEFGCETFSFDGKVDLIILTDKIKSDPPYFVTMGHTIPSSILKKRKESIFSIVKESLSVLKIKQGPVNFDIVMTDKGPKIIDIGARLGGNYMPLLVYLTTGINLYKEVVNVALGQKPDLRCRFRRASAVRFLQPNPGKVKFIKGLDSVLNIPGLALFNLDLKQGDTIKEIAHTSHRIGSFVVVAPNKRELVKRIRKVEETVKIKTGE